MLCCDLSLYAVCLRPPSVSPWSYCHMLPDHDFDKINKHFTRSNLYLYSCYSMMATLAIKALLGGSMWAFFIWWWLPNPIQHLTRQIWESGLGLETLPISGWIDELFGEANEFLLLQPEAIKVPSYLDQACKLCYGLAYNWSSASVGGNRGSS